MVSLQGAMRDVAESMTDMRLSMKLSVIKDLIEMDAISEAEADKLSLKYHKQAFEARKAIRQTNVNGDLPNE